MAARAEDDGFTPDLYDSIVPCPRCTSLSPEIDVFCNNCGKFLIVVGRKSVLVLVLAILGALVLFRESGATWPLYLLVTAAIIHLYAVAFSRGAALSRAAVLFALIVGVWGAWELGEWFSTVPRTMTVGAVSRFQELRETIEPRLAVLSLPLWLLGILWGIALGRSTALPGVRLASSYFLGIGAFLFGLWGVWATLIENQLVLDWVFQLTTIVALTSPLILLVILLGREPPEGPAEGRGAYVAALWLSVITAYLFGSRFLIDLVEFGLGTFLPRLLGHPPLPVIEMPWLLRALELTVPISSVLTAFAAVSVVAASAAQTASGFEAQRPSFYTSGMEKATVSARRSGNDLARLGANLTGIIYELLFIVFTTSRFVLKFTITIVENVYRVAKQLPIYLWRMIRFLIVPIISFSLLSFAIILVLRDFATYTASTSLVDPKVLWGEAMTVIIFALVLCGASFGFARSVPDRFVSDGYEAAVLGFIVYVVITVASFAVLLVWIGFERTGIGFNAISPGGVYATNSVAVLALLAAIVVFQLLVSVRSWTRPADRSTETIAPSLDATAAKSNVEAIVLIIPIVLFAAFAIMMGFNALKDGLLMALNR